MAPKLHAIMVSLPFQGHINPFVNLAIKLASKGVIITFVHLEFIDHMLSKIRNGETDIPFQEERDAGLDIRYATINDGFDVEFDRNRNAHEYWPAMDRDFPCRVAEFIKKAMEAESGPDNVVEQIDYLPGVDPILTKDFLSYLKESQVDSPLHKAVIVASQQVKKSDFIVFNTVEELESKTLSVLNKYQPTYAIGPVNLAKHTLQGTKSSNSSLWLEADCTNWLSSKPPGSVLYISFGSQSNFNPNLLEEIAHGLLLSHVNFIWVVRDNSETLPVGFVDATKDRGLVVPWCDQIAVLSDPAVGGFLTHSAWNSTLESIWFGVTMISYPMNFEQPVNRKLVVDDWKIGINLCDDGTMSVDRKRFAEKIDELLGGGDVAEGMRKRVVEVGDVLRNAIRVDGSSERNLDRFIEDVEAKVISVAGNTKVTNTAFVEVASELVVQ